MKAARALLILLPVLAAGCAQQIASVRPASTPSNALLQSAMDAAARQVRGCYRSPRIAGAGRQIATRLRIRVAPDGTLSELPSVMSQTGVGPANQVYARRMAEAAIQSVVRCAPLRLPEQVYGGDWVEIDLTFSPLAAA